MLASLFGKPLERVIIIRRGDGEGENGARERISLPYLEVDWPEVQNQPKRTSVGKIFFGVNRKLKNVGGGGGGFFGEKN